MNKNEEKKYGRTIFDLIAEHPKYTLAILIILFLTVILFALLKIPMKMGELEVGEKPKVTHDTIVKTTIDTQWVKVEPQSIKTDSRPVKKIENPKPAKDTVVVINEKSNVNNGVNNGIIGNNNDVKINVNEIHRKLDDASKQRLLDLIGKVIRDNSLTENSEVMVMSQMSDSEALAFAREIQNFLKQKNLKINDDIGQFQSSPIVAGVSIGFNKFEKKVEVRVGYRTKI